MVEGQASLRFELLGAIRVRRGNAEIDVGPTQQREMLGVLLARYDHPTTIPELQEFLWLDPPRYANNLIYRSIGNLRKLLEPDLPPRAQGKWLVRNAGGYIMRVDESAFDLLDFRAQAAQARKAAARTGPIPPETIDLFTDALAMWRGRCADSDGRTSAAEALFASIDHEYTALVREASDAALRSSSASKILPVLQSASARDRWDEGLQARLMLSLASLGRQADAIQLFHTVRENLVSELGVDPGEELRDAYQSVLTQSVAVSSTTIQAERTAESPTRYSDSPPQNSTENVIASGPGVTMPVPSQLPSSLPVFVGRDAELAMLDAALAEPGVDAGSCRVAAIEGIPGVGKTSLALYWAHRARKNFPDGQLYINLRGYDAQHAQVLPSEALRGFLTALGISSDQIPTEIDAQSALFRSLSSDKRILIILDNARDAEQIRPLLPGGANCSVVVTSRGRLVGLAAQEGASLLVLNVPSPDDARVLLARRLGASRLEHEQSAVEQIITRCARLPLALAIVAERAAGHPGFRLAEISRELGESNALFGLLEQDGVEAVFSWSYQTLSAEAAQVFRLLALSNGPDLSLPMISCLADSAMRKARGLVRELIGAGLLTEHTPGRFVMHDLIRQYSQQLAEQDDAARDLTPAVHRLGSWLLQGVAASQAILEPYLPPIALEPIELPCPPPVLEDSTSAVAWCEAERPNIVAITATALDHGLHRMAWNLATGAMSFYDVGYHLDDRAFTQRIAIQAARNLRDVVAEGRAVGNLANVLYLQQRYEEARGYYMDALRLHQNCGYVRGQAVVLTALSLTCQSTGQADESLEYAKQALDLAKSEDLPRSQATALLHLGTAHGMRGELDEAESNYAASIKLYREIDDQHGVAYVLSEFGIHMLELRRDYTRAGELLAQSADLYGELHREHDRAVVLGDVATAWEAAGRTQEARSLRSEAIATLLETGDTTRAQEFSAKLQTAETA
jgi:DNA-binding SARP family transcriptional activator